MFLYLYTVLIIPCRCGIDLDLFYTWGNSFVYTSELPLSSWYIIERKIRSMGFSEAVYFPYYKLPFSYQDPQHTRP